MARITVEDCVKVVKNRFELVLLAARRARDLSNGSPLTVARDNDKNPIISLREIAEETVSCEILKETIIKNFQKVTLHGEGEGDLGGELEESLEEEANWYDAIAKEQLSHSEVFSMEEPEEDEAEDEEDDEEEPEESAEDEG